MPEVKFNLKMNLVDHQFWVIQNLFIFYFGQKLLRLSYSANICKIKLKIIILIQLLIIYRTRNITIAKIKKNDIQATVIR